MERRPRQRTALRALSREVWGEPDDAEHMRLRARRKQRMSATAVTAVGGQLLLTALGLVLLSSAASAHTSTINIACAHVEFVYENFPNVTATAHESVVIDGIETAQRDITFHGPGTTDTITISLGPGKHTVAASDHWAYNGSPQGSAQASEQLNHCNTGSTTTSSSVSTSSTSPSTSTSSSTAPTSTSTSTVPETTSTTVPGSTTSVSDTSTSTVPDTSTSTAPSSTSTTAPTSSTTGASTSTTFHELGSTTTTIGSTSSSTVHEQGSTSTTSSHGRIPFTGSSGLSLPAALGALGVGILTLGLSRLRKVNERS